MILSTQSRAAQIAPLPFGAEVRTERRSSERFHSLDSLRGLAALMVVITHLLSAFPDSLRHGRLNWDSFLYPGGRFSVMMFFVLSGFVLSLPYLAGKNRGYPQYAVRRILRIYPAFAVAVLIASLLAAILGGHTLPSAAAWFNTFWATKPTPQTVLSHLLMTGIHLSSTRLDSPIWSLVIEMRISLLFPLLVLFVARFRWKGVAIALLAIPAIVKLAGHFGATPFVGENVIGATLLTCRYIPLFMLGGLVATYYPTIRDAMTRIPNRVHLALVLVGLMACIGLGIFKLEARGFADLIFGLFAAYLISISAAIPGLARRLTGKLLSGLGKVSYSLYLIHVPAMLALSYLFHQRLPLWAALLLALPVSLLAATLMYRFVELPSIQLGHSLANKIQAFPTPAPLPVQQQTATPIAVLSRSA